MNYTQSIPDSARNRGAKMTKRKNKTDNQEEIGKILKNHREDLEYSSRIEFIQATVDMGLLEEDWISEKSLSNIEIGYNMPSLRTLKKLSIALQIDLMDLISEIIDYI